VVYFKQSENYNGMVPNRRIVMVYLQLWKIAAAPPGGRPENNVSL
jgi:hypothetical protein